MSVINARISSVSLIGAVAANASDAAALVTLPKQDTRFPYAHTARTRSDTLFADGHFKKQACQSY